MGGGIIGTAAALDLARAGASVALFEATAIGAGASGRNSGSVQHPFDEVLAPLHRATLERYRQLAEEAPDSFVFPTAPAGLLLLAPETAWAVLEAERAAVVEAAPELDPTILTPAELVALEPSLAPDLSAVRLETGHPVPPAAAVGAFARLAEAAGTRLEIGRRATLERREGRAVGVRTADGRVILAEAVLVAAGPWSPELIDPTGAWRPIVRTWGVTVATRLAKPPEHVLEQIGVASVNRAEGLTANAAEIGHPHEDRPADRMPSSGGRAGEPDAASES
ncbi:MAG TPA: FAD-dependent oxidoreductase, partial [Methylomirabilota bacterium]|nr:FAD-dependent oxidoreductase [Methylomirabilota bacterium]